MNRFQVFRTNISPYQRADFISLEEKMVGRFPGLKYETQIEEVIDETILITNTHTDLTQLSPLLLKKTKLIIHPNSGYDNFAREHDLWKRIPVVIGHTIRAQAVAEYTLGAIFEGLVELPQHISWHKERSWERTLLKDTPVWIFGYGHIGSIVADTLATLGMKVTVVDPYIETCPHRHLRDWKAGNVNEARVVIAAMGLNSTSQNLFNEEFFSHLNDNLLFINGARGKLVSEKALREYLLTHPGSFAFLDVFEKEPFTEEWHGFPQVWKTSHIAGVEKDLDRKILNFEEAVLQDFLSLSEKDFFKKYENELLQNKWKEGVLI